MISLPTTSPPRQRSPLTVRTGRPGSAPLPRRRLRGLAPALAAALTTALAPGLAGPAAAQSFAVSFPASAHAGPITGRVFVVVARDSAPEPRVLAGSFAQTTPLFGMDVSDLAPGETAVLDGSTPGYPVDSPAELPEGDYWAQAILNVYTQFHRADGHVIWAHMDQWEGQRFNRSPGNLVSDPVRVHIARGGAEPIRLRLTRVLPPVTVPPETGWVKRVRIESPMLTRFWGHPMYLGATVLLPKGYEEHPDARYPVVYIQGHFGLGAPFGFSTDSVPVPPGMRSLLDEYNLESGYDFYRQWTSDDFPRMIAVTFQHPTPYFDDSYAVNSANNGPYGDALLHELIPYLESHFRMIAEPYARVLTGGSTGGWESLALQVHHPDFFGGTWTLYPDPVDFRHYGLVDAYADSNAFIVGDPGSQPFSPVSEWFHPERYVMRGNDGQPLLTMRQMSRLESVLGSHGRSGEQLEAWEAVYGPVGEDGYPVPLWDKATGRIDHDVAAYMREHGYDLRAYLDANWATVGPKLADKIHVDVGDMDNFYLNLAVMDLERFLATTTDPHVPGVFHYGRPGKGHGWEHTTPAGLVREMAAAIARHAPADAAASTRP